MAVIGALIPLPAMLALLGHRIDKYTVRKSALTPKEDGGWAKTAHFVMRRPVAVLLLTLVGLSVFAAPIKDIAFGQVDSQVLPKDHPAAVAARVADERFPGRESVPVEFVIEDGAKFLGSAELMKYQEAIGSTEGILYLTDAVTSGEILRFNAIHSMSPRSLPAEALIDKLREIPAPDGTLIGGAAADYTDINQMLQTGQAGESYQEAAMADAVNRFNFAQQAPYQKLQSYLSGAYGAPAGMQQTTPVYRNPIGNVLGGALTGAALGGLTGSGAGAATGAGIGAGLGLLG
jgi:uncharacterized membrane protein YdfJ with MMPL/SSD domain